MPRNVVTLEAHRLGKKNIQELMLALDDEISAKQKVASGQVLETIGSRTHRFTSSRCSGTRFNLNIRKINSPSRSAALHLPEKLSRRLSVHCANQDKSQSDIIASAVTIYLDSNGS